MNRKLNISLQHFKDEIAATINFRARELDTIADNDENILIKNIMIDELKAQCDIINKDIDDMNKKGYLGWKQGNIDWDDFDD